jgi:hypothetical protein
MVDSRVFSARITLSVNLQSSAASAINESAKEVIDAYWSPLWQWSSRAAVSGRDVKNCIFREIIK